MTFGICQTFPKKITSIEASSKGSRSDKSENLVSPKSQKSFTSIEIDSPPANIAIDIDMPQEVSIDMEPQKEKKTTPIPTKD